MDVDLLPVSPTDSCERAIALMKAAAVDLLPVVDGGRLVGTVTEAEIRRRAPQQVALGQSSDPEGLFSLARVSGVMSYAPPTVTPDAPLADAVRTMLERGISSLAVVEGDRLVGLLTPRSILAALRDLLEREARSERNHRVGNGASRRCERP